MLGSLLKKVLGSRNDRQLKRMGKLVAQVNGCEAALQELSDEALQAKTGEFRQRLEQGETLDQLLPEAFAVTREASRRVMGMRHFDVQLVGGLCLHQGKISEMRTGEGKTLVATLPVYLNALSGKGVHVVTVNDYLAQRDANWMRPLYEFLGLSVGVVVPNQDPQVKKAAYACDITYGTNNEFGFDYLRDNMAFSTDDKFQRELNFAIVDEVDSILIDEARTPLIISGPAEDSSEMYQRIDALIPELTRAEMIEDQPGPGHYTLDEKTRQVDMTEEGHQFVEERLQEMGLIQEGDSLYASQNLLLLHHVYAALRAHAIFQRNIDYIVQNGQVVLVDEHTGRTMPGRRLSEGLHQALEAKERVQIQPESQTLASTTFQNYFRLYNKLAGMTGTADTEAYEFQHIYGLEVLVIPTHKEIARKDMNDLVYLSLAEKYDAIIEDVKECSAKGQPVLVGTASIESSELLSNALNKGGLKHQVLNAKFHEKEAEIIAQAGRPGTVTIATNMAGRGTDIVLGGNFEAELAELDNPTEAQVAEAKAAWQARHDQVIAAGGLHIVGTERHESRRIDNQLRGRAGRQGDPGSSRFYLSLEDSLMRIFASERVKNFMKALGMEKGEAIEHRMVSNAIEKAQRKVEGRNFDIRKQLLEYDDVANDQRQVVYAQRNELMASEDVSDTIQAVRADVVDELISEYIPAQSLPEQWDIAGLEKGLQDELAIELPVGQWLEDDENLHEELLRERILEQIVAAYSDKEELAGVEALRTFEKHILLRVLDDKWKEHLAAMDHLRQGIHLRGYAAKNPKQEYKRESFELFQGMLSQIKREAVKIVSHVQVRQQSEEEVLAEQQRREALARQMEFQHAQSQALAGDADEQPEAPAPQEPVVRAERKVGRNESCPCGSGKKYKHCHGRIA